VVRLFVDGCQTGSPAAEMLVEEENVADINYTMFGLDANGSKFFDGELAEFLAYSEPIPNMSVDQVKPVRDLCNEICEPAPDIFNSVQFTLFMLDDGWFMACPKPKD